MKTLIPWGTKQVPIRRTNTFDQMYPLMPFPSFDRLVEDFFGNLSPLSGVMNTMEGDFSPSLDIHETNKAIEVTAEVPGIDEKDIKVSLSNDTLTITGEKKYEKEEDRASGRSLERRFGSFVRAISLPAHLDTNEAHATYKNGVLTITIPKSPEYQKSVRTIPIHTTKTSGNGGKSD